MGASGSGKSHYVKGQVKRLKPKRLVIWDAREEYGELATPTDRLADVLAGLRSDKRVRLAYRPKTMDEKTLKAKFEALCKVVFAAGDVDVYRGRTIRRNQPQPCARCVAADQHTGAAPGAVRVWHQPAPGQHR